MLESKFGRHRSVFFFCWSCDAYGRLTFVRLDFHCAKEKAKREEKDEEKKEKQYFQFIFSYVDFRRFTKLSLIFYWIGYCGQFLYQLRLLSRQSSITLSSSLRLASFEWVSQLFSNRNGHSYKYKCVIFIFNILLDIHEANSKTKHTFYYLLNCDFLMSLDLYVMTNYPFGIHFTHNLCSISIKSSETFISIYNNHFKTTDRMPFN